MDVIIRSIAEEKRLDGKGASVRTDRSNRYPRAGVITAPTVAALWRWLERDVAVLLAGQGVLFIFEHAEASDQL